MDNYLKKLIENKNITNILCFSDRNYFIDTTYETEIISENEVEAMRWFSKNNFLNKKRRPLYYKYNLIVIEEAYLKLLNDAFSYWADNNAQIVLILSNNFKIEYNNEIIKLLDNQRYQSKINNIGDDVIIEVSR